jgi:acetyltransferase-like isoleucine patch superfamily enzyme
MIEQASRLSNLYWRAVTRLYFAPQFGAIGRRTLIRKPLLIRCPKGIAIGDRCGIRDGARFELVVRDGRIPELIIGDDVSIEQDVQFSCGSRIKIGSRVTIAARCFMADISHPYDDVEDSSSIGSRLTESYTPIEIGDECFLGVGCVILPGVILGKRCIVGANSVVTKSMPDYTVCAGVPAKPLKRYDPDSKAWVSLTGPASGDTAF